jgi:hypothetical protein
MILDEIISIKKVGIKKTVDITVDGDHLFYCNGILTHNSAAGDVADVTEENIQGGISKIQAADNVIGFIPNAHAREVGTIRAKFLKTRDSGGVGKYVDFKTEWSTLTFDPWHAEDGASAITSQTNLHSNLPSQKGNNERTFVKTTKPDLKRKTKKPPSAAVKSDADDNTEVKSASSVIRGIKGRTKPNQKKIKLV